MWSVTTGGEVSLGFVPLCPLQVTALQTLVTESFAKRATESFALLRNSEAARFSLIRLFGFSLAELLFPVSVFRLSLPAPVAIFSSWDTVCCLPLCLIISCLNSLPNCASLLDVLDDLALTLEFLLDFPSGPLVLLEELLDMAPS